MWMMHGNDTGASVISFGLMNVVTNFASISLSRSSLLLSSLFLVFSDDISLGQIFFISVVTSFQENMTDFLLLRRLDCNGGPIFKVVLEVL